MAKKSSAKRLSVAKPKKEAKPETPTPAPKKTAAPSAYSTQREAAKALNVTARTLRDWISEGMPVRSDKTYDVQAIRKWRTDRDNRRKPTESEILDRKIKEARLRQLDMEFKRQHGQLVPLEEVERGRTARIAAVKQALLAIPRGMAKILEHQDARQIEALLKDKITEIIKKFAGQ